MRIKTEDRTRGKEETDIKNFNNKILINFVSKVGPTYVT